MAEKFPVRRQTRQARDNKPAAAGSGRRQTGSSAAQGELRIIGGRWRGRRLSFLATPGLRPTTDRVRETLFNWLMADIPGARCVDLFCGSGALGLEALSRGATHCDFVDSEAAAIRQLTGHLRSLDASQNAGLHCSRAEAFLARASLPWDIVFIDPPFGLDLVQPVCDLLANRSLLAPHACVYVETARQEPAPAVPEHWQLHREKSAGGVTSRLYRLPDEAETP